MNMKAYRNQDLKNASKNHLLPTFTSDSLVADTNLISNEYWH